MSKATAGSIFMRQFSGVHWDTLNVMVEDIDRIEGVRGLRRHDRRVDGPFRGVAERDDDDVDPKADRRPSAVEVLSMTARVGVALLVAAIVSPGAAAWTQSASESALKAAFLLNFAKFTEWPTAARGTAEPLLFCCADAAVSPALQSMVAGQMIGQRPLAVSHVALTGPLRDCALLYVGRVDKRQMAALAEALRDTSVLTVGDDQAFAAGGGMIGLFVEEGRMRFAINIQAAERGRLRLSAKLLNLARVVKD